MSRDRRLAAFGHRRAHRVRKTSKLERLVTIERSPCGAKHVEDSADLVALMVAQQCGDARPADLERPRRTLHVGRAHHVRMKVVGGCDLVRRPLERAHELRGRKCGRAPKHPEALDDELRGRPMPVDGEPERLDVGQGHSDAMGPPCATQGEAAMRLPQRPSTATGLNSKNYWRY